MYIAYRTRPVLDKNEITGEWKFIRWLKLGLVKDMAEAKRVYGGSPVLEEVR